MISDKQKTGIIFIVIGVCIPLLALPFLSGYSKDKGLIDNLYQVGIELKKDKRADAENKPPVSVDKTQRKVPNFSKLIPKRIPFRLFLVITVILLYVGIAKVTSPIGQAADSTEENE